MRFGNVYVHLKAGSETASHIEEQLYFPKHLAWI